MFQRSKIFLSFLILITSSFSACKQSYNQIAKSNDLDLKMEKAKYYYKKKEYHKAVPLFEELLTIYKGSKNIDDLYYMYAKSHFEMAEYLVAGFHFKNIYDSYPNSPYAEECLYLNAVSAHRMSPITTLDQEFTEKALQDYQFFINAYPNSKWLEESNKSMRLLRRKMEIKAYESAYLYYKTKQYRAAATSFKKLMRDYPDSQDLEKASFYTVKSYYFYAKNSVLSKQIERYQDTMNAFKRFNEDYPQSQFFKEAEGYFIEAKKIIDNYSTLNHSSL